MNKSYKQIGKPQPTKPVEPTDWSAPKDVSDLEMAFPAQIIGTLLPRMTEIPDEFKRHSNPWCHVVSMLFFKGGSLPKTKPGVDARKASRQLQAVLGSFEPKHEHKEAGAAWLMSMWYEMPKENQK